jgi:hypothetical protein
MLDDDRARIGPTRRWAATAVIALLTSIGMAVAVPAPAWAISSGEVVNEPNPFPFVALLRTTASECTATLVAPQWALTAGHCIDDGVNASDVRLQFNFTRRADDWKPLGGEARTGVKLAYWNSGLGLVKLDRPITDIAPIALAEPEDSSLWEAGTRAQVVGWGRIDHQRGTDVPTHELRTGWNKITDANVSAFGNGPNQLKSLPQRDSAGGNAHVRPGDSGGPLLVTRNGLVQIGVADYVKPWKAGDGAFWEPNGKSSRATWIKSTMAAG